MSFYCLKKGSKKGSKKKINKIDRDKNELDKIREKQKRELMHMLETNLKSEYLHKENELKSQLDKNKQNDLYRK